MNKTEIELTLDKDYRILMVMKGKKTYYEIEFLKSFKIPEKVADDIEEFKKTLQIIIN